MNFQYLMPIFDFLIAGGITYGIVKFLLPRVIRQKISEKIISTDFHSYAEPIIEEKIDHFIYEMKKQIPLASMFVSNSLIGKLRSHGKGELIKAIPEIKQRLLENFEKEQIDFTRFIRLAALFAATLGGILGFINLAIALWL